MAPESRLDLLCSDIGRFHREKRNLVEPISPWRQGIATGFYSDAAALSWKNYGLYSRNTTVTESQHVKTNFNYTQFREINTELIFFK